MKKKVFSGVGTAIVTPFKNGEVDYDAFAKLINRQIEAKVDALVVLGTTGEPATLTADEREQLLNFSKEQINGRTKFIVGCGSNNTAQAIKNYKRAEKLGADGALIVTPYYNKCTQNGLIEHYKAIGNAGDLPIIVYNVPGRTGVNVLPETMKELSQIKNICGLKEASGNITQICEYFRLCGQDIDIYSGEDALNAVFAMLGGSGEISVASNIFPKLCKKILNLCNSNQYEQMLIYQNKMIPFIKQLFCEVNPIPVKAGLNILGLIENELRLPLTSILKENYSKLQCEINALIRYENDCM